jgi:hypothetical protein
MTRFVFKFSKLQNKYKCTSDSESAGDYFFSWAKHLRGHFWDFFKIPSNAPLYVLPQTKKNPLHFQNQRYIGFVCPCERKRKREPEPERGRERARE